MSSYVNGLTYNLQTKKWSKTKLKEDYNESENTTNREENNNQKTEQYYATEYVSKSVWDSCASTRTEWETTTDSNGNTRSTSKQVCQGGWVTKSEKEFVLKTRTVIDTDKNKENKLANLVGKIGNKANEAKNKVNSEINKLYDKIESIVTSLDANTYTTTNRYLTAKKEIEDYKNKIEEKIKAYKDSLSSLISEYKNSGGTQSISIDNYMPYEPSDAAQAVIDEFTSKTGDFRNYYKDNKVTEWDTALGAATPADALGYSEDKFNADYYLTKTNKGIEAAAAYKKAKEQDNLDIIERYPTEKEYALWHYTNIGKSAGERGSDIGSIAKSKIKEQEEYKEEVPGKTESIYTDTRDKIFGLGEDVEKNKIKEEAKNYYLRDLNKELKSLVNDNSKLTEAWESAKRQLIYYQQFPDEPKGEWIQLTEALKLDPDKLNNESYFGRVLVSALKKPAVLSEAEFKKIQSENKNIINSIKEFQKEVKGLSSEDVSLYITKLDEVFAEVVGEKEEEATELFGEMRKDVLEEAKQKLIDAQEKESMLDLFKQSAGLGELENLETNLQESILGDSGIGGLYSLTGTKEKDIFSKAFDVDLGLESLFGTKNGLIYNWEDWFYKEIEKKYAGGIDIPDDYVSSLYRTKKNGYIDKETLEKWKKYDDAYDKLASNPNDKDAKKTLESLPSDYIKKANRKEIKQTWLDFEKDRLAAGFVDTKTLDSWSDYDDAFYALKEDPNDSAAKAVYDKRPSDYIAPDKRVDYDIQLAQNFFTDYLKPRFDQSKSLSEFQSYLDVEEGEENIFQTEDRMTALKRAAESTITKWFSDIQKLGDSSWNAEFYKDPIGYYKKYGVRDDKNSLIVLDSTKFNNYVSEKYTKQKDSYDKAWEAAKKGLTSKDAYGKDVDWVAWGYHYGLDSKSEKDFAKLHYLVLGQNAPKTDKDGNIIYKKNEKGETTTVAETESFDPAPDVFGPELNTIFIKEVLTPYLKKKSDLIGSVFGQFVKPSEFVDEIFSQLDPTANKEELSKLFQLYGLKETADLTELKELMVDGLTGSEGSVIQDKIDDIVSKGDTPTQTKIGVDYIQRESDKDTKPQEKKASGLYAVFKDAGYTGSEDDFYSDFMPDSTEEEIQLYKTAYSPSELTSQYTIDFSSGPEKALSQLQSLMGEEEEDIYSMTAEDEVDTLLSKMKESSGTSSKSTSLSSLFKFDDEEEDTTEQDTSSSKISTGSDFLSKYKKSGTELFSSAFGF